MALAVFNWPTRYERSRQRAQPMVGASFAGSAAQQRARITARPYAVWSRSIICDNATKLEIEAFFDALYQTVTSFLWQDPDEPGRVGASVTPAAPDGVTTAFVTPAGEYPANDGRARLYRAGVNAALASVATDTRTLTASAAPTAGAVAMTADYSVLRRVVLSEAISWEWVEDYWSASFQFVEVVA